MPGGFARNKNPLTSAKVNMDDEGIFIRLNGTKFRPGAVEGYDHRFDMREGSIRYNDSVYTMENGHKAPETGYQMDRNIRKISTSEGAVFWHAEGKARNQGLRDHPEGAVFTREGTRQPFVERDEHGLKVRVPHYAGEGRVAPGKLDTYRIPRKEEANFREGEPVHTMYGSKLLGKHGSALEIRSYTSGAAAKAKLEINPPAVMRQQDIARVNALSMASGFGR